jgi:phage terminase small subunit
LSVSRLTKRQKRFCEEYVIDFNATQAYFRAGYSVKSEKAAGTEGYKLLKNPGIQAYIKKLQQERSERTQITADRVLQEYARLGFSDITQVASFDDNGVTLKSSSNLTEDVTAAIADVISETTNSTDPSGNTTSYAKKRVKMHDKVRALEMLARHTGIAHDLNYARAVFRRFGVDTGFDENGNPYAVKISDVDSASN